ncbi:lipopolysaccharide biosynthesis protein [Curvivirga sp.]|uniref:lipopolysaccharide biosynthesis protein n=1 Tax=Curvivirga sp. TaxID=2856848 RepID=UPI003B5C444D
MQLLKKLPAALQQSAIYALALAGAKGISLLMIPIFTHYLSPEDYGRLDILQTLADILSIIIGLGLADTLFRFCNENEMDKAKEIAARLFGLSWIIAAVSFLITQMMASTIADILPGDVTEIQTRLILTSLSLSGTILVPLAWLRLRSKAGLYLAGSLGRTAFQAGFAAILVAFGFGVTGFVFAGFVACVALSAFMGYLQLKDTGIKFDFAAFKAFGPYGGPLIFTGIAGFIMGSFDRWILADAVGTAAMAQYALAAKFGLITAVLIQPYDMWWQAKRFSMLTQQNGREKVAHFSSIAFVVVCAAVMSVCAASPLLITWLTPVSYHQSITYVPYLVAFAAIHNLTQTLGFGIYTEKTTKLPALIDGACALIAFASYFLFIPAYGIEGAILATFIALGIRFGTTIVVAQNTLNLPYPFIKLVILAVYTGSMVVTLNYLEEIYLQIVMGMIAIGVLGGMAVLMKFLKLPVRCHEATRIA